LIAFVGSERQLGVEHGFLLLFPPVAVLSIMGFCLFRSASTPQVRSAVLWLSDRVTVFLFLLVPLFASLSIYVILRNLL
jgi:hypothetical protein